MQTRVKPQSRNGFAYRDLQHFFALLRATTRHIYQVIFSAVETRLDEGGGVKVIDM